jgi:hypothetical protein
LCSDWQDHKTDYQEREEPVQFHNSASVERTAD